MYNLYQDRDIDIRRSGCVFSI